MVTYPKIIAELSKIVLLFIGLTAVSCQATVGPEGPAGQVGPSGAKGEKGDPGIANVQQITYTIQKHDGVNDLFLKFPANLTTELIERSVFYVYVKQTVQAADGQSYAYWFVVPGETYNGNEYSFYIFPGTAQKIPGLFIHRVANFQSGSETFEAVRIFTAPASTLTSGRRAAVDYTQLRRSEKSV